MKRRRFLAAALVGATAGCLRLESDSTAATRQTTAGRETTTRAPTDGSTETTDAEPTETTETASTVASLSQAWDETTLGLDVKPTIVSGVGETLHAAGRELAAVDTAAMSSSSLGALDGRASATAVTDDAVFLGTEGGAATVTRIARDGSGVEWTFEVPAPMDRVNGVPVQDGMVFAGASVTSPENRAALHVLDASSGERVDTYEWGSGRYVDDVVAYDGVAYVGVNDEIAAYDADERSAFDPDSRHGFWFGGELAIVDGVLYSAGGGLDVVDLDARRELYSRDLPGFQYVAPAVAADVVVVGGETGLYAFDRESGDRRWHVRTTATVRTRPVVQGDLAFAADDAGVLYAVRVSDGELVYDEAPFEYSIRDLAWTGDALAVAMDGLKGMTVERE